MEVLELRHRGVPCILPAKQVVSIDAELTTEAEVALWDGEGVHGADARWVIMQTALGPRRIRGRDLKLRSFHLSAAYELPPLLRDVLKLPHVVGVSDEDGAIRWLVDGTRFEPKVDENAVGMNTMPTATSHPPTDE